MAFVSAPKAETQDRDAAEPQAGPGLRPRWAALSTAAMKRARQCPGLLTATQADTVGHAVANQLSGEYHGEIEHALSTQEVNNG